MSRSAIKLELADKLVFDDERVFQRLRVNDASMGKLVNDCARAIKADSTIQSSIEILQSVAANAERRKVQDLEDIEHALSEGDLEPGKRTAEEKKMYKPLETIFSFIEDFQASGGAKKEYSRHFVPNAGKKMKGEAHTVGFPAADPDFVCREPSAKSSSEKALWRHSAAFLEVKPSSKQGPQPSSGSSVLSIVAQSADYARLHMSARPFQLFSVGLLIFGNQFCAAIFDRGGITFSPIHDMWQDLDVFIRVVRRVSCDLSPHELGQDPTADMLMPEDPLAQEVGALINKFNSSNKKIPKKANSPSFPTFKASFGGTDPTKWVTVGPPLWNSVSLIGRGTSVWRVYRLNIDGTVNSKKMYVMKSAWRSSKRDAESDIYGQITSSHPGVAKFEVGKDVCFPGSGDRIISVDELRTGTAQEETQILHRVILSTLGRSLYEYPTEVLLLKAVRAAIEGHRYLKNMGILHRDISIGNVFLSNDDDPGPGAEGFVADLDYASTPHVLKSVTKEVTYPPQKNPGHDNLPETESGSRKHTRYTTEPALRGAMMTGTVQFMAIDVLKAISGKQTLQRKVQHDLESFIWVLAYAVRRRLCHDKKSKSAEMVSFQGHFGQLNIKNIYASRKACIPLDFSETLPETLLSSSMQKLFQDLRVLVEEANLFRRPVPLTYDSLTVVLDDAIAELEG